MKTSAKIKQLKLIKTLWGIDEPNFQSIREEGYHGIEVIRLAYLFDRDGLIKNVNQAQLALVCQIHTCGGYLKESGGHEHGHDSDADADAIGHDDGEYVYCGSDNVEEHKLDFKKQLLECQELLSEVEAGGFINVHAGTDSWTLPQAIDFLTFCMEEIEKQQARATDAGAGRAITVTFETHRQRLFGNPFQTRDILDALAASGELDDTIHGHRLKLNADLSHWYCACERVFDATKAPDDGWWPKLLERVAERCYYIHARFGWAQGPQMADPAAKECEADCKLQLATWAALIEGQRAMDDDGDDDDRDIYISPEYGPAPYLATMPHTQTPIASLPSAVSYTKGKIEALFQGDGQ